MSFDHPSADRSQVSLGDAASRPSKTNCTSPHSGPDTADVQSDDDRLASRTKWWRRKNEVVDDFIDRRPERAARPVSVRDDVTLREDATQERHDSSDDDPRYRSATWSSVLNEFVSWYNDYRYAHLKFRDPDGETVRSQMPNSHQPRYGDRYYARIKALERELIREYSDPHVCMLSLTGSTKNANGGWRCPADHVRDVVNSFRPERGRGVYHKLRDVLDDADDWEYALVVEHHKSGYGHVHVAVFVDGAITEEQFRPVIDEHLRNCDIAGREAHDYHHPDPEKRPISVREVDLDLDPEEIDDANRHDVVGNLGSYVGEYIGAHGEELLDRSIEELQFRAVCWATGTQRVRFSNGAQDAIARDLDRDESDDDGDPIVLPDPDWDGEGAPFVVEDKGWSLDSICRVDDGHEAEYEQSPAGVNWCRVEDARHVDPPKQMPPDRPQPRTSQATLTADDD